MQRQLSVVEPGFTDIGALPVLTGKDIKAAIDAYHQARSPLPAFMDSEAIKKVREMYSELKDKSARLTTRRLLELLILLVRTNPAEDITTSTALSDLLGAFDGRVIASIKGCLDLGGNNSGDCLRGCLNLMCAYPDDALKIALSKSLLHVVRGLGANSPVLEQYYKNINTDALLAGRIYLAVKTLANFGYLFRNPAKAADYLQQNMPGASASLSESGLTLFAGKNETKPAADNMAQLKPK